MQKAYIIARQSISIALICTLSAVTAGAVEHQVSYKVIYSGGSLPTIKSAAVLKLFLDPDAVRLKQGKTEVAAIPNASITEVSYGQEVHRRIGTAVATAVFSFGIGLLVALSKSKKHYIGIVWDNEGTKGGIALQADKNEFRGMIAALQGLTGKTAIDTDSKGEK
jgi:hypothetical protein